MVSSIDVPQPVREAYYRGEPIPDPWGSAEAILTHTATSYFGMTAAHSPLLLEAAHTCFGTLGDPRDGAELISSAFLCSMVRGLSRSPGLIPATAPHRVGEQRLTADQVRAVVMPESAVGNIPFFVALHRRIPVILVRGNHTSGRVTPQRLGLTDQHLGRGRAIYTVASYAVAAGLLLAMREGIAPAALMRPIQGVEPIMLKMIALAPISVLNYLQLFSRRGILIKDGRVLDALRDLDSVVFDKTGTLTAEQPEVARVHLLGDHDEACVLGLAASAEHRQTHPVARAIQDKAAALGLTPEVPEDSRYAVGFCIRVQVAGRTVRAGSARFMQREGLGLPAGAAAIAEAIAEEARDTGHALVYVGIDDAVAGIQELAPSIRPEARALVAWLHARGIEICIISGDGEAPTRQVAARLGVDQYFAGTLPQDKAAHVRRLREAGRCVCFVGDGINDAVALKSAQVSISLKGASTAATDTAQVIFMGGSLAPMRPLFELAHDFERTMRRNLLVSIAPGVANIAGIYLLHIPLGVSMAVFYGGTAAGLVNSILPLVRRQQPAPAVGDGGERVRAGKRIGYATSGAAPYPMRRR